MSDMDERINYYVYESEPQLPVSRPEPAAVPEPAQAPRRRRASAGASAAAPGETEIDLIPLLQAMLKKWWLLLAAALLCAAAAFLISRYAITPMYSSDFTVYVSNRAGGGTTYTDSGNQLSNDDINASRNLAQTCAVILTSRSVLNGAVNDSGLDISYEEVSPMVKAEVQESTQIIKVTVTTDSRDKSLQMAQSIEKVSKQYIENIVNGSSVVFPDSPQLAKGPSSPNILKNTAVGFLLGLLLAAAFVVIRELTDKRVRSESDLEEQFGIPVIGTIPDYRTTGKGGRSA